MITLLLLPLIFFLGYRLGYSDAEVDAMAEDNFRRLDSAIARLRAEVRR
jgi:hypothetical protein